MRAYSREDGSAAVTMAVLRATLVAVIFASEQLTESKQLAGAQFYAVLGLAGVYAMVAIAVAVAPSGVPGTRALVRAEPVIDVWLLTALAYTSGGAFSDVRKAFFVVPLAAAFSERPRLTANWSLLAVAAFTLQAVIAAGHPVGVHNSWPRMTLNQDLYLTWTGWRRRCWRSPCATERRGPRSSQGAASDSSRTRSSRSSASGRAWRARCTTPPCRT